MTNGGDEVLILVAQTVEECAIQAESMYLSGVHPICVHRASSASADAVVAYLRSRPTAVPVGRSPDNETPDEFRRVLEADRNMVHVYFEQVCDVCGALPPLFHVSVRGGFFCRACAVVLCGGESVKTAGQS